METTKLKKFAQFARRSLIDQVSTKLKLVLAVDSVARRESAEAVKKLEEQIKANDKKQVIEKAAYIWFNRFCALRFMDVNRYTRIGVVSPAEGHFQPEILAEAKMGHIDEDMVPEKARQQIFALLDGKTPSRDPQGEAYRLLVVAACNDYHKAMPYLFERIDDYTELLMPDDLLSGNSILAYTREAMTPDACQDVEVIGWLYQFYISEKKDAVFDNLKKNKKIAPENIPAATQLFTPHWIVRYLVENSLGRIWMLNRPNSQLIKRMDYYIKPEQVETDFLHIGKPEEIKICDPACGSGHMLTYAFDLLYTIYEEEGYEPTDIPEKILTHNLYGIEIDERAGELAAFALTMNARAKQRRFFRKQLQPNICVLENIRFDEGELKEYMDFIGRDLFNSPLQTTLHQFEEAGNFGSLIHPDVTDVAEILEILESKNVSGHLFLSVTHQKVLQALQQADYLSHNYHVVVANPPYMGSKGMNGRLAAWAKDEFPNCWDRGVSDLYAMFIERAIQMTLNNGSTAMITMQGWMFTSSFETLRASLLSNNTLSTAIHLGARAFDSIAGQVVSTVAFVFTAKNIEDAHGHFFKLTEGVNEISKNQIFLASKSAVNSRHHFVASSAAFRRIPGSPISYWITDNLVKNFNRHPQISTVARFKAGLSTGDNTKYQRMWHEVNSLNMAVGRKSSEDVGSLKWVPCNSGGSFRKWYGNNEVVILWSNNGSSIKAHRGSAIRNENEYFKPGLTYNKISSGKFACRIKDYGFIFDDTGRAIVCNQNKIPFVQALLSSTVAHSYLDVLAPTLSFTSKELERIPFCLPVTGDVVKGTTEIIRFSKNDWDSYETSWDFATLPLLNPDYRQLSLKATYHKLRTHWRDMTLEMQRLEEENNRIFIDAYGLQDELTAEVPLSEITLTCNPHYRYSGDKSEDELEALLLADTMKEFISYAVGCMFGRYALGKPGLILANQGETIENYLKQITEPSFPADDDNVIPMLDGDWFTDDIAERFRKFLRVAFGEEHYEANITFIGKTLGKNGKARDIRDYFLKDFYTDHVKRYKKRPIYWLFSSSKGSFNALVYMHRYRPRTVDVVLNDYLREFRTKLTSRKNHLEAVSISASGSQSEKTKALKEIEKLNKMITEMEEYEREVLYPLATERVEIDLDDGVKANYPKLGAALKNITGMS